MSSLHVVFGSGPIGRAVVERLLELDAPTRVATRSARPQWLDSRVDHVRADATDSVATAAACSRATHVYNCTNAADYHRWPEQFPPLQRGVLAGARAAGAVLIAVENLYVYGPHEGAPMTEQMPLRGHGLRSTTRVAMTLELEHTDVPVVRVRGSDLIGQAVIESMAGARLFKPILAGAKSVQLLADPSLPHAVTSAKDFGRTMVAAALNDAAHGQVFHVPSPSPTPCELVEAISSAAGLPVPRLSAPSRFMAGFMLPVMGLFVPPLRGLTENLYMFYEPFTVDATRAKEILGLAATPLSDTIREALAWYRQEKA